MTEEISTYTPIWWATLSDDEKYAECIRLRQRVNALLASVPTAQPRPELSAEYLSQVADGIIDMNGACSHDWLVAVALTIKLRLASVPTERAPDVPIDDLDRCRRRDHLYDQKAQQMTWRCHKRAEHEGACSSHNDCGATNRDGVVCGKPPGHAGPHGWQITITNGTTASSLTATSQPVVAARPLEAGEPPE